MLGARESDAAPNEKPADTRARIGFSRLVVRLDGYDSIGLAREDFPLRILERLRSRGLRAVGGESLIFDKDESNKAQVQLGGTVRELACASTALGRNCRVGIEWQLFDVERREVVYQVMERALVVGQTSYNDASMATDLVMAALDRLVLRTRFQAQLARIAAGTAPSSDEIFEFATIARCAAGRKVAEAADDTLNRTVVVLVADGFGSGVAVSPDGLFLTAAHVVENGPAKIKLRDGTELAAEVVRRAPHADVALLRTVTPLSGRPCALLRTDTPSVGTEVYAAGAPASLDLAFSLTRGIISGLRLIDGRRRLQTDASLSPGNSGGPLLDADGRVIGLVASKFTGGRVEGLGFAVPTEDALAALGLRIGDATDRRLYTERATELAPATVEREVDVSTPIPSTDPDGDALLARKAEAKRKTEERERYRTWYVEPLRWGGLTAGIGGAIVLGFTAAASTQSPTETSFHSLRDWNTVGWVVGGLGTAAFVTSFFVPQWKPGTPKEIRVGVGPTGFSLGGTF
jgi:serine protease Do